MSRSITVAAAQLGPIQMAEPRSVAVERMVRLMERAHRRGVELVVFPELALTTFFPRHYHADISEADHWYETAMPSNVTALSSIPLPAKRMLRWLLPPVSTPPGTRAVRVDQLRPLSGSSLSCCGSVRAPRASDVRSNSLPSPRPSPPGPLPQHPARRPECLCARPSAAGHRTRDPENPVPNRSRDRGQSADRGWHKRRSKS